MVERAENSENYVFQKGCIVKKGNANDSRAKYIILLKVDLNMNF